MYERRVITSIILEKEEEDALDQIRWREHKSKNDVKRKAVQEFIKNHGAGNDSFTLDNWESDPDFKAIPSIMDKDSDKWEELLYDMDKKEFFDLMRILNERRQQMMQVMKRRKIRAS